MPAPERIRREGPPLRIQIRPPRGGQASSLGEGWSESVAIPTLSPLTAGLLALALAGAALWALRRGLSG
jgi:hypothetical protein